MLKKVLVLASLAAMLVAALANAGCASSSGFRAMLAKVPSDTTSLKYVNVKALRKDADLEDLYDAWKDGAGSRLEAHGISPADVSVFATNAALGKRFTLLVGNFDLDAVREDLEDRHYREDEYRGAEVWEREAGWGSNLDNEVALMGDLIIMGDESGVEGCIKVMKSGDASWLSKADVNDVASRLSGGLYVDLEKSGLAGLFVEGFEAFGISAKKLDGGTLKVSGVAKFDDEDSADDAEDAIENLLELQQFEKVEVSQAGDYLEAKAELDIDNAESLF